MDLTSKYDRFLFELQAAAIAADVAHQSIEAAQAIDTIVENSPKAVIEGQTTPTWEMVNDYVRYVWEGGPKPQWLEQAGL